jgi:hypothetical protein
MKEEPRKSSGWWQTVPGILTAAAGAITAIAGLLVALHLIGLFDTKSEQPVNQPEIMQHRAVSERASTVNETMTVKGTGSETAKPPISDKTPQYPVSLVTDTQVRVGEVIYRILAAELDRYSDTKLSLKFLIRVTNIEAKYGVAIGSDYFRLIVEDIPFAPEVSIIEAVALQSAKEGEVKFIFPATTSNIELQVGEVGRETKRIPIDLKATKP